MDKNDIGEILDTESSLSDKQKSSHQSYFTSAYEDYNILIYFFLKRSFNFYTLGNFVFKRFLTLKN